MNNTSNSTLDSSEDWFSISWKHVNKEVLKLKFKIWKYSKNKDHKKLRDHQKLMVHSVYNILYSIRKVTQTNTGSGTPGLDDRIYSTPKERMELFYEIKKLNLENYNPIATKRIYIPKGDGRLRPLGIPTLFDRVIQQMIKNALEPEFEAKFEATSYGFRPNRSVNDAINKIYLTFNSKNSREWVVDADISGCFDNIDHSYLLNQIILPIQIHHKQVAFSWFGL